MKITMKNVYDFVDIGKNVLTKVFNYVSFEEKENATVHHRPIMIPAKKTTTTLRRFRRGLKESSRTIMTLAEQALKISSKL
ncbi:unnamed protein product [Arabis nemorensis]|uniref:Uncharacterized protein n=1 Tax=Arabis nemorensis TaxID=586526 RepID=A0A565BEX4_9BRAS|nr:unnamed protein product [Arabis nemorensis]